MNDKNNIYNEIIITSDECQVLLTCEVVYADLDDRFQLHDYFFFVNLFCVNPVV